MLFQWFGKEIKQFKTTQNHQFKNKLARIRPVVSEVSFFTGNPVFRM